MKVEMKSQSGLKVTQSMRDYAEQSLNQLGDAFKGDVIIEVKCKVEKFLQSVEVSVKTKTHRLRVKAVTDSYYDSIDLATDKLKRNIRKYNRKLIDVKRNRKHRIISYNSWWETFQDEQLYETDKIAKIKEMNSEVMTTDEAITRMKLMDHAFFLYKDSETQKHCTLYQRNDGNIGLITQNS